MVRVLARNIDGTARGPGFESRSRRAFSSSVFGDSVWVRALAAKGMAR